MSCSTAEVILGQGPIFATSGSRLHRGDSLFLDTTLANHNAMEDLYCNCIPDAKRGYYGFIIVVVLVRVRRDFLLATYSPHFFPDFFQYLAGGLIW